MSSRSLLHIDGGMIEAVSSISLLFTIDRSVRYEEKSADAGRWNKRWPRILLNLRHLNFGGENQNCKETAWDEKVEVDCPL